MKDLFILGAAVPGEALETMVKLGVVQAWVDHFVSSLTSS
jgi:hypothetical protein